MTVDARLEDAGARVPPLRTRLRLAWRTLASRNESPLVADAHATEHRYGYGRPPHPELNALIEDGREAYRAVLETIVSHAEALAAIPVERSDPRSLTPAWNNSYLPGLDAAALYCLVADLRPRRYIEVGSGNSTMFVRRSIQDNDLPTQVISIDPYPRANIDSICDSVVRAPLARADLRLLLDAEPGDMLFLDGSHLALAGSDVVVAFLEVLPKLKPGVIVQVHDIFLPYDYPPRWSSRLYSEQYVLAMALLSAPRRYRTILPNMFIASDSDLRSVLEPLWARPELQGVTRHGGSYWIRIEG